MKSNQKETVKHHISYRFVCEHCGTVSEWRNTAVGGETQEVIFDKKIPSLQKEVAQNNYSSVASNGKCAKCGKRQSWEVKNSTFFMKWSLLIGLGVAGSLGWVVWFLFGLLGFVSVFVIVSLISFIYGLVDYIQVSSHARATSRRNKPEIIWTGVDVKTDSRSPDAFQPETNRFVDNQLHDNVKQRPTASFAPPPEYKGIQWFFKALRQYADFNGRARRKEYWMFVLFNMIFAFAWTVLLMIIFALTNSGYSSSVSEITVDIVYLSYGFLLMLPSLALAVRRLHDVGKSGWMLFIALIPLVGGIWLLVLMLTDGQEENNEYGSNPKTSPEPFSDRSKLKSAGITLIVASVAALILTIFFSWIFPIIHQRTSIMLSIYALIPNILAFAAIVLLLIAGFYLLDGRTIFEIQEEKKNVIVLLLTAASISLVLNILNLLGNFMRIQITGWNPALNYVFLVLFYLSVVVFTVSILFSSHNKDFIRKTSVAVIVFSSLCVLWDVYFYMGNAQQWIWAFQFQDLFKLFYILTPAAFIVLAGTFYPKKRLSEAVRNMIVNNTRNQAFPKDTVPTKATTPPIRVRETHKPVEIEKRVTIDNPPPEKAKVDTKKAGNIEDVRFSIASFQSSYHIPGFAKENALQILEEYLVDHQPKKMSEDETELLKPLFINLLMHFKYEAYMYSQTKGSFGGICDACNTPISKKNFYLMGNWAGCQNCALESIVCTLDWNYYLTHIVQGMGFVPNTIVAQALDIKDKITQRREALS